MCTGVHCQVTRALDVLTVGGVGTAYYCLPVDMTMFVFEQHFEAPGVVIETRVMVGMFVLTGIKVAYESQEWV